MLVKLISGNQIDDVLKTNCFTLIKIEADWCGPCRSLTPIIEDVAFNLSESDLKDKISFYKVDIDKDFTFAKKFRVMGVPTTLLLKSGLEVSRMVGLSGKDDFIRWIEESIKKHNE